MLNSFTLVQVTCNNSKVLSFSLAFLNRCSSYPRFDFEQKVRVYVDSSLDFVAWESLDYGLSFLSSAHSILDTLNSPYKPLICPFSALRSHFLTLSQS